MNKNILHIGRCFMALLMLLSSVVFQVYGQTRIEGVVKDSKGIALPGAIVILQGNDKIYAVTSDNGSFVLTVPAKTSGAMLEVRCLGYKNLSVAASSSKMNIVLNDDIEKLDEVIVIGYGTMRRSDLTGSVSSVRIDETEASQSTSFDQLIQGKAAGVQVVANSAAPGDGVNLTVRGRTSLTGNSQPLYVVDGVLLTSAEDAGGVDGDNLQEHGNSLLGINPQDIASIEILKDASATAIYGAEGANGVVMITTKMAGKEKPVIKFSLGLDYVPLYKRYPTLLFDEYVEYLEANTFNTASLSQLKRMYDGYVDPQNRGTLKVTPVDWQEYSFQNTFRQRYYLSVAGHPGTLNYNFSMGYNNTPGTVKTTGLEQFTFRLNIDKEFGRGKFKIGTKLNGSYAMTHSQRGASTGGDVSTSMMRSILVSRPYLNDDDDEEWEEYGEDDKSTPAKWIKDAYLNREQYRFTPNLYFQWKITPWLTFKLAGGGDFNMQEKINWTGVSINHNSNGAYATSTDVNAFRWNIDALFMFDKTWGNHSLSGTLGFTTDNKINKTNYIYGYNIDQYYLQADAINSAPNATLTYGESITNTLSTFLRAVYNYKERYILTATVRVDGSSKFSNANKFAVFPSFAFAWRMNRERWFDVDWISQTKIRLGWGEVGNSGVAPYQTFTRYNGNAYPTHDPLNPAGYSSAMTAANLANDNLKWETTRQVNGGIDLSFWQGRLAFTVDAYYKMTYDLLNSKKLPYSSGYTAVYVNQGQIQNAGVELTLSAVPVKTKSVEWTIDGNISLNRNKIIDIGTDSQGDGIYLSETQFSNCNWYPGAKLGSGRYFNTYANIFAEGQPMALFYGLKTDGVVQEGETAPGFTKGQSRGPGYIRYKDLNGDGYISDEDRTIIGNPNPDFTFGFGTSVSYKKLTLSLFFNGSYGNDICNLNRNVLMDTGYSTVRNVEKSTVEKAWYSGRTDAVYPQLGKYQTNSDSSAFSDLNIEDGSFIRLSNISLSYRIPIKKCFIRNIDLQATAGNVFVWTNYSGWDPEVSSFGANARIMGIDAGSYPGSRSFKLDVKFTF